MTSHTAPTAIRSPSRARSSTMRPLAGAGIWTTALSVSISASRSFSLIWSPTPTVHFSTSTSARPSPTSGNTNSRRGISALHRLHDGGQRSVRVQQEPGLELLHRVGRVGSAHTRHRSFERVKHVVVLLDRGN